MEIKIKVPDSVITAAGYGLKDGSATEYEVKANLPKYITLPAGAADTNGNLIVADSTVVYASDNAVFTPGADDTATFSFEVTFGWGTLFNSENPGIYLDKDKKSITNLTDLLNIAKAESTTANYTELTAEAKRDILQAMKKAIEASEAKFTVVVNAQAK